MKLNTFVITALIALTGFSMAAEDASPRGHELKAQYLEKRQPTKRSGGGMMTWYGGGMLSAPACGGSAPQRGDMVVAVKQDSGYGKCNQKVRLHHKGKSQIAVIRDYCADCKFGHFDATQGLFEKFADLTVGELKDLEYELL